MPRVSLRLKLLVSITGVTFVTVIFGMLLAVVQVGRSLETQVNRSQAAFLEEVAPALESGAPEAIALVTARARRLGIGTNVFVADPLLEQVPSGPVQLTPSEGAAIRGGGPSGDSRHVTSSNAFAWRLLSGGARVAVIVQPWEGVSADTRGLVWILATVVCVAAALSLCLSIVLSRDVGRTTDQLKASVDCVATGDLRGLRVIESEDELGALAHSFERMTRALRNTVGGVARAADRVEMAAREIASVCGRVSGGAEEQKEEVERAAASMVRVNDQVSGIAHSSQGLAGLVDDSGQAVLELGAAADELGGTAGVLRARVDEVTGSVEEMVRSVREVGTHTSALSEAASDTTSRMQQMADAMRSADAAAGESVRLSEKAVSVAEAGRDRVRETIDGMRSISESIGRAEVVVRGLGGRAHEIGAILDVIDDVADETSLLALNAAIIAAQAGDHGRGFAVVADEIKELADRVLASTKEIGDLIRAVQTESANAALAISEGARSVAAGMERSEEAGASLSQVTAASHESRTRILEIVESVREQAAASEHVAALMLRVRDGMEVIRRATREQERGNEVVFRSTLGMREVAEQVHATTQEQSRGASGIRHDIDGVRGAADAINAALHSQAASWSEVLRFLEQVSERGAASREEALVLDRETRALHEQAERLRRDIAQFTL